MDKKFLIFVFFEIILFQNSHLVDSSEIPCGIPEEEWKDLEKILINELKTVESAAESLDLLFDILGQLAGEVVYQCTAKVDETEAKLNESLSKAIEATGYIIESVKISLNVKTNSYISIILSELQPDLVQVYLDYIPELIELSKTGDYYGTRDKIESLCQRIYAILAKIEITIYETVRLNCGNEDDTDVITAINTAEGRSLKSLRKKVNAVFNSAKLLSYEVSSPQKTPLLILANEGNRKLAKINGLINVGSIYSLLKSQVTYRYINKKGTAVLLSDINYALTIGYYEFKTGTETIFETLKLYLTAVYLGLKDAGTDDLSSRDILEAVVITKYNEAIRVYFELITKSIIIESKPSQTTLKIQEDSILIVDLIVETIFDIVDLAQSCKDKKTNDIQEELKKLEAKGLSAGESFVKNVFAAIRGKEKLDEKLEELIASLLKDSLKRFGKFFAAVEQGITILVNAYVSKSTSKEDFEAIDSQEAKAVESLGLLTTNIATLLRVIIQYDIYKY